MELGLNASDLTFGLGARAVPPSRSTERELACATASSWRASKGVNDGPVSRPGSPALCGALSDMTAFPRPRHGCRTRVVRGAVSGRGLLQRPQVAPCVDMCGCYQQGVWTNLSSEKAESSGSRWIAASGSWFSLRLPSAPRRGGRRILRRLLNQEVKRVSVNAIGPRERELDVAWYEKSMAKQLFVPI